MMQMMSGMMGMMKMMHGHGMAGMGMSGIGGMGVGDHIEGRIAFLHAELKIAGDQEMLWAAFADVMRENAKASTAAASHGDAASTGIVGALNAQSAALEAKLAAVNKLGTTLNPLYAALSEEQKKLADELIGPQIGMGSAKRGGGVMPGTMGGMAGSAD